LNSLSRDHWVAVQLCAGRYHRKEDESRLDGRGHPVTCC
jgi:hypothetical protein